LAFNQAIIEKQKRKYFLKKEKNHPNQQRTIGWIFFPWL
jgi:hypothetical protein